MLEKIENIKKMVENKNKNKKNSENLCHKENGSKRLC